MFGERKGDKLQIVVSYPLYLCIFFAHHADVIFHTLQLTSHLPLYEK